MKQKPTLILFCGLPGSGKTTLAKQLEALGRGIRICTDDWQADLEMNHNDNNFHVKLQRRLYQLALELLDFGQDVILEDGLWTRSEREEKLADAKKRGAIIELHYFDLSLDEIWKRLEYRNSNLPHGAIVITQQELKKCWDILQKPTKAELHNFDKVFVLNDANELS